MGFPVNWKNKIFTIFLKSSSQWILIVIFDFLRTYLRRRSVGRNSTVSKTNLNTNSGIYKYINTDFARGTVKNMKTQNTTDRIREALLKKNVFFRALPKKGGGETPARIFLPFFAPYFYMKYIIMKMQYLLKFKTLIAYFIELNWPRIILNWILNPVVFFLLNHFFELNPGIFFLLNNFLNWILKIFFWI